MDAINLLQSRDFSYETLDFIDNFFQKNLSGGLENNFRELLFELFEGKGLNTKTKKSDLYTTLEDKLKKINHLVREIPRDILATNWTFRALSGEEPSPEDTLKAEKIAMLSGVIQGSLKIKVISRYEKLLPKRRTKDFKEKYPFLENAFKMYEQYNFNVEAEQKYMTIHNNNGISDIIHHLQLNKFKDEEANNYVRYGKLEVKYVTPKGNEISLDLEEGEGIDIEKIVKQVNDLIGARQSLLIIYIMNLAFEQSTNKDKSPTNNISIDVKEYCKLRGINYRSDTADAIYEDIEKLKRILVKYEYLDNKGKEKFIEKSPLISNRGIDGYIESDNVRNKRVVKVNLGAWIDTLSYSQYQHIRKDFFKYDLKINNGSYVSIGFYLNNLHRNNLHKSDGETVFKVEVSNLTSKLGISEQTIKKGGYSKRLKAPLEKVLTDLEKQGYQWKYKNNNHTSRKEFEEDVIIFKNPELDKVYEQKGYKKKSSKNNKK